jgi:hypothetical protein
MLRRRVEQTQADSSDERLQDRQLAAKKVTKLLLMRENNKEGSAAPGSATAKSDIVDHL